MEQELKIPTELMNAVEHAKNEHQRVIDEDPDPVEPTHVIRPRTRPSGTALMAQMMALSAHSGLPPDAFDHIWGRTPSLDDLDQRVLSPKEARAAFKPSASDVERQNNAEAKRARKAAKLAAKGL